MKKHIAIFIALIVMATVLLPSLSSCQKKTVESIEVMNPVIEYLIDDTIDYDKLMIKVTYTDKTTEEKTVKQLKAKVEKADLSKAGNASYTVTYGGKSCTVNIRVTERKTPSLKEVNTLEAVDAKVRYAVNETIDYDNIVLSVTYSDGTSDTDTVRALGATVKTYADVSKAGKTYYEIVLNNKTLRVDITVVEGSVESASIIAVAWPRFYEDYLNASVRENGSPEGEADFRLTEQPYEVGNANKFLYRPQGTVIQADGRKHIELQTYAEVAVKDTSEGEYRVLSDEESANFVTVDHNSYKFTESAAGKYVRLKISIDETYYDLSAFESESDKYRMVEFVVIDKGYNVYDQIGLSVMSDLEKQVYSEIWKCDVYLPNEEYVDAEGKQIVVGDNEVKLVPREDSLRLAADDKYLCEYVDNISTVILHDSIILDADLMPSQFFWTEFDKDDWKLTGDRYQETFESLAGFPEAQKAIVGSLRDGYNNVSDNDGAESARSYMRLIDTNYTQVGEYSYPSGYAIELNIHLNMQKGIFSTKKVDVSGNYNSITAPERGQRSDEYGRVLESYADYEPAMTEDPVSHWALFQMLQSRIEGDEMQKFEIKNIALKGNNSYFNDSSESYFHQAGLMLCNNYAKDISFTNVNADSFYTNISGDNYGDYSYIAEGDSEKFHSGEGAETDNATLTLSSTKFYDAYSNMIFLWRSHAVIENSELKRSGGPLFIMSDADHACNHVADKNFTDEGGPSITVDTKSKLESFATGNESWYKIFQASSIVSSLGSIMTPPLLSVGKTFYKKNEQKTDAINVIAVMICAPDLILDGGNPDSADKLLDVRGGFTQVDDEGKIINDFKMHNKTLTDFRTMVLKTGMNATSFAPIIQSGNSFSFVTPPDMSEGAPNEKDYVLSELTVLSGLVGGKMFKTFDNAKLDAWKQGATDKLCLYLSVGPITQAPWAPYVGIITDLYDIQ